MTIWKQWLPPAQRSVQNSNAYYCSCQERISHSPLILSKPICHTQPRQLYRHILVALYMSATGRHWTNSWPPGSVLTRQTGTSGQMQPSKQGFDFVVSLLFTSLKKHLLIVWQVIQPKFCLALQRDRRITSLKEARLQYSINFFPFKEVLEG